MCTRRRPVLRILNSLMNTASPTQLITRCPGQGSKRKIPMRGLGRNWTLVQMSLYWREHTLISPILH